MFCVVASALVLVAYSPLASISEEVCICLGVFATLFCKIPLVVVVLSHSLSYSLGHPVPLPPPLKVPSWAFALHAICIFAYQTLDGCDGKQAGCSWDGLRVEVGGR